MYYLSCQNEPDMNERESSKKVHKLKIDTRFPFRTIGISCHENDYRLIWAVNAKLNTVFVKIDDFKPNQAKNFRLEKDNKKSLSKVGFQSKFWV